ncbi:hypothetical protein FACS1894189_4100 [Planctomycetales bacterium]|nr:hypothetical protein FACS1894189_4100 [Planctomycetales bacterium]
MSTLYRTVDIPADRQLTLTLSVPVDIPTGKTDVRVEFTPTVETTEKKKTFRHLAGVLKDSNVFEGDSVELQRRWRDEWEREWEKER